MRPKSSTSARRGVGAVLGSGSADVDETPVDEVGRRRTLLFRAVALETALYPAGSPDVGASYRARGDGACPGGNGSSGKMSIGISALRSSEMLHLGVEIAAAAAVALPLAFTPPEDAAAVCQTRLEQQMA